MQAAAAVVSDNTSTQRQNLLQPQPSVHTRMLSPDEVPKLAVVVHRSTDQCENKLFADVHEV